MCCFIPCSWTSKLMIQSSWLFTLQLVKAAKLIECWNWSTSSPSGIVMSQQWSCLMSTVSISVRYALRMIPVTSQITCFVNPDRSVGFVNSELGVILGRCLLTTYSPRVHPPCLKHLNLTFAERNTILNLCLNSSLVLHVLQCYSSHSPPFS